MFVGGSWCIIGKYRCVVSICMTSCIDFFVGLLVSSSTSSVIVCSAYHRLPPITFGQHYPLVLDIVRHRFSSPEWSSKMRQS